MLANVAFDRIVVEEAFAFDALRVVIVAAIVANKNVIVVRVYSERNVIGGEVFVALRAKQIFIVKATGANVGTVVNNSHLPFIEVFFAMFAKAIVLVQAVFADVNALAVAIDDFPSFGAKVLALLTELGSFVAVVAEKPFGKLAGTRNAKSIGADLENLEVVGMVLANGNLSVEIGVRPVRISAEAVTASNTDVMFVAAVFFGFPEIRHAFKLGKFTLNKIAIKLGFSLGSTSAAVCVVEATLKQEPVEGLVHEKLASRLAVIDSFGLVRVGGSEDDESHVVASVTGTATVVIAIDDVEGVAGSHSVPALVPLGIAHGDEVSRVDRHEKFEVNLFSGKLVGELGEKMLELTVLA